MQRAPRKKRSPKIHVLETNPAKERQIVHKLLKTKENIGAYEAHARARKKNHWSFPNLVLQFGRVQLNIEAPGNGLLWAHMSRLNSLGGRNNVGGVHNDGDETIEKFLIILLSDLKRMCSEARKRGCAAYSLCS